MYHLIYELQHSVNKSGSKTERTEPYYRSFLSRTGLLDFVDTLYIDNPDDDSVYIVSCFKSEDVQFLRLGTKTVTRSCIEKEIDSPD